MLARLKAAPAPAHFRRALKLPKPTVEFSIAQEEAKRASSDLRRLTERRESLRVEATVENPTKTRVAGTAEFRAVLDNLEADISVAQVRDREARSDFDAQKNAVTSAGGTSALNRSLLRRPPAMPRAYFFPVSANFPENGQNGAKTSNPQSHVAQGFEPSGGRFAKPYFFMEGRMSKPATYWSERLEAGDEFRRQKQLEIARNMILAGIEAVFLITGSGLEALEQVEVATGGFLAAHGAKLTAEVEAIETAGSA